MSLINASHDGDARYWQFMISFYALLKSLQIHDVKNAAVLRPFDNWTELCSQIRAQTNQSHLDFVVKQQGIFINEERVAPHFSIVEAERTVRSIFEIWDTESLKIDGNIAPEQLVSFLKIYALAKPNDSVEKFPGITVTKINRKKNSDMGQWVSLRKTSDYALNLYYIFRNEALKIFDSYEKGTTPSFHIAKRCMLEYLEIEKQVPARLVAMTKIHETRNAPDAGAAMVVTQAVSTSLLSLMVSGQLELKISEQIQMGLVGLLYNVGLYGPIRQRLVTESALTTHDYKAIADAQLSGVQKLLQSQSLDSHAVDRLLAIYENNPNHSSTKIASHLESRLLRLVSQYVAMTSDRPYRDAFTPSEALKLIGSKVASGGFDPILYFLFARALGPYPVGSLVQLTDHTQAVVCDTNKVSPEQPTVVMVDSGEYVELAKTGQHIAKSLNAQKEGVSITGFLFPR